MARTIVGPRLVRGAPRTPELAEVLTRVAISGYEQSRAVLAEPITWVWRGIIAEHHAVEICGGVGDGKSTFAALLAVARANPTGKPIKLLGREVAPMSLERRALWLNEENGRQSAVAQIDRAIDVLGLPPRETWERIVLVSRAGVRAHYLGEDSDEVRAELHRPSSPWSAIVSAAAAGAWGIIVLDTRAKILGDFGASKDEEGQADAARLLTSLVERARCPVVVLGHRRKGDGSTDLDAVSGSAQRAGGADVVLLLAAERRRGRVVASTLTTAKQRDDAGDDWPEPVRFALARDDGAWTLRSGEDVSDDDGETAHERVHEVLSREGEMTARQIRDALGMSSSTLTDAVAVLRAEQRLTQRETVIGGRRRIVYRGRPTFAELRGSR